MSINKLVEYDDDSGDYTLVWEDKEEEVVVVQYNFVHFTMETDEFKAFASALDKANQTLEEESA